MHESPLMILRPLQMLVVGDASELATPSGESTDGVTPPMRNVQK